MPNLWNGHRAVVSLTFDDGLPCQLEHAIPILNRFRLPGTFFLIDEPTKGGFVYQNDLPAWQAAHGRGHELGCHSAKHKKAASMLSDEERVYETATAKQLLEKQLLVEMPSYCYPYTDAPEALQQHVRRAGFKQARGGRVARLDKFVKPGDGVNLFNVPCYHINEGVVAGGDALTFVDAALERNAWVTFMFHGVGDSDAWDNVNVKTFEKLAEGLAERRDSGLWTATFADAGDAYREASNA